MNQRPDECPMHWDSFDNQKAAIHRSLRAIIDESFAAIAECPPPAITDAPAIVTDSYEEVRAELQARDPIAYQKAQELLSFCDGSFSARMSTPNSTKCADIPAVPQLIQIPVGSLDNGFACSLLTGTVRALEVVEAAHPRLTCIAEQDDNAALLRHHTYQGLVHENPAIALAIILRQGIIASAQGTALATADRMPDSSNKADVAADLTAHGAITALARRIGSKVVLSCVRHGKYPQPVLTSSSEEGVRFSPQFQRLSEYAREEDRKSAGRARACLPEALQALHDAYAIGNSEGIAKAEKLYSILHYQASLGTTCPAAVREGGVQQSVDMVLRLAASSVHDPSPLAHR